MNQGRESKYFFIAGVLVLVALGCFFLGSFVGPAWALPGEHISYNEFETRVKEENFNEAVVDGNIISLVTKGGQAMKTEAPDVGRAVGLLIKFDVAVRAYRPVPASGITWPVVIALLIPYGIIGFYAFALAKAAAQPIKVLNEEPSSPATDSEEIAWPS